MHRGALGPYFCACVRTALGSLSAGTISSVFWRRSQVRLFNAFRGLPGLKASR